jgi:hypothetical protein
MPDYLWFNGTVKYVMADDTIDPGQTVRINRFLGGADDPGSRIWPVKIFHGKQPYDKVYLTLLNPHTWGPDDYTSLWSNFDWKKALESGMQAAGRPYSGEYGFVQSEMVWPITHMVAPAKQALKCAECHSRQGRLQNVTGIYVPGRDRSEWLDMAGFTLAGLAFLGVIGHGALRIVAGRKRREH